MAQGAFDKRIAPPLLKSRMTKNPTVKRLSALLNFIELLLKGK